MADVLTEAELAALEAAAEAATPGPRRFVRRVPVRPRSRKYRADKHEDEAVIANTVNGCLVVLPMAGVHVAADERLMTALDPSTVLRLLATARALRAERDGLRAEHAVTMGVGTGDGNLFVHGTYESIKAAQAMIDERDMLRAALAAATAGQTDRRNTSS